MDKTESSPNELEPGEVATFLGVSVWTVYRRMKTGVLRYSNNNPGGRRRKAKILRSDVERLKEMEKQQ